MKNVGIIRTERAKYLKLAKFMVQYSGPKPAENNMMQMLE